MQNNSLTGIQQKRHWASFKEAGTLHSMKFLLFIYKIFGRKIFSILVYPISLYFVICRPAARQASLQYLRMHYYAMPNVWKSKPTQLHSIIHFKQFAEAILDKLLAWVIAHNEADFELENSALIDEIMSDQRGQLVIGSHFGNLEFCRGFMQRYKNKIINILVYDQHSVNFVTMMKKMNPESRLNIYQVDEFDVQTMLLLKSKTGKGEWVFIAGDRIPLTGLQNTVEAEFFGEKAFFPIGGYILAKILECPVKFMFAYRKNNSNKVYFSIYKLSEKLTFTRQNRKEKIQQYSQAFAAELERHCKQAPYQWFNFYDFWAKDNFERVDQK